MIKEHNQYIEQIPISSYRVDRNEYQKQKKQHSDCLPKKQFIVFFLGKGAAFIPSSTSFSPVGSMLQLRRKREEEDSLAHRYRSSSNSGNNNNNNNNNNSSADVGNGSVLLDASSMSAQASHSSRARKRRRKKQNILESLSSIGLTDPHHSSSNNSNDDTHHQIPHQIVKGDHGIGGCFNNPDDNSQLSDEVGGEYDDDDDDDDDDDEFLSDIEKAGKNAQRAVMLELVFGKSGSTSSSSFHNPVDVKIEQMVRQSIRKVSQGERPIPTPTSSLDDMAVETSYTRSSSGEEFHVVPTTARRQRSNSLPCKMDVEGGGSSGGGDGMDVSGS